MTAITDQDHTDHADRPEGTGSGDGRPSGRDDRDERLERRGDRDERRERRGDRDERQDDRDAPQGDRGERHEDRGEGRRGREEGDQDRGERGSSRRERRRQDPEARGEDGERAGGAEEADGDERAEGRPERRGARRGRAGSGEGSGGARTGGYRAEDAEGARRGDAGADDDLADSEDAWDDGLIARRVNESAPAEQFAVAESRPAATQSAAPLAYDGPLRSRLDALRELVGLSRARLDSKTLTEAGRVLDEAAARRRLSGQHTVVAIAGATGSGKSQLFNALAGVTISETGVRRPTTAAPIACSWSDGAATLIDRLGIPGRLRRRPLHGGDADPQLRGLVLIDLPDHDSAAVQHREQVDRILALVDAVVWVVDPEKYADAILHERYLRPMAGHAEVMFVVLNQIDRLPGEAAEQVLDDLRRLLDEDGIALGEYGEPGATVLALSALTGEGVGELRDALGQFVTERGAPARRISADVDAAAWRLRPVYVTGKRAGLSEEAREEFSARLADAVGATAAGEAAERAWLRNANRACGTPWLRLWRWYHDRREPVTGRLPLRAQADAESTARQRVEHAVRTVSDRASAGLPAPWAQAVREAAARGAQGLPEALDELAARAGLPPGRPPRPGWWPAAVVAQACMTILQVVGGLWLLGQIIGFMAPNLGVPVLLMVAGIVGGPLIEWSCRMAARGPARRYGQEAERRLREAAAGCGRARVLDPVAAELLRYREVREQYGKVIGVGAGVG
ncbi:YfjP family GTPase [Streptomyces sp. DH24]|uniref:YfjP family GTPase n=1 Tax=Streptomyces sp. DH24 TaxID=3040123 RepID=UPI0024429D84|nr:YfjP family GTPase [Streptomyces sp. DH24]MDG9716779.1 YfjP family GTPase [Streptomyces sp. DH24]